MKTGEEAVMAVGKGVKESKERKGGGEGELYLDIRSLEVSHLLCEAS